MENNRIAIIGSNGYIGKHLSYYLQRLGFHPMCYDIQQGTYDHYKQINIVEKSSVTTIDLNVDYIYMFAGLTGTYVGFDNYKTYNTINEVGLMNLLDEVRKSGYRPKVIFPSTRLIYKGSEKALCETDEKETKTIYAINKQACENILYAYKQSFEIPYTIFRICIPYGNLFSTDYSFGTVGFFIKQAQSGKDISLYGDGNIKRTFTHIEDLCYQIVHASMKKESDGEIYNIGGETLSLKEAAEIIAKKFGVKVISVEWPERDLKIESGHTYFDDTKIRALLKFGEYKRLQDFSKDI